MVYKLSRTQFLPIGLPDAWSFFASPQNLIRMTPERMNFRIIDEEKLLKMHAGQRISYVVSVLPLLRVTWVTEITEVKQPDFFIDDQLHGPFKLWRHAHKFRAVAGGVEMSDEVEYALPLGPLGRLAHWLFVEREVNRIFNYRNEILKALFPG